MLADQVPRVAAIEACATSHHCGRVAMEHGHNVRLFPANYVKPFVKRQKNAFADAAAIAKAASRSARWQWLFEPLLPRPRVARHSFAGTLPF